MKAQILRVIDTLLERNEDGTLAEITETTQLAAAKLLQDLSNEEAAIAYGDFLAQEPSAWMWTGVCPRIQLHKPIGVINHLWKPLYTKAES